MSVGEYVAVFSAILVGLAVGDILLSFHRLLRRGRKIRWDWITLVLTLVIFCFIINFWWAFFAVYSTLEQISFIQFMPDTASLITLFLLAAVVLPDEPLPDGASLRDYYLATHRHFWILMALYIVFSMMKAAQVHWQAGGTLWDPLESTCRHASLSIL